MAGKKRFSSMTEMMEFFKKTGSQGGKKRAANLTKKELAEIGKKGALARWGKKKAAKAKGKSKP
jgi:general stress protein YciG